MTSTSSSYQPMTPIQAGLTPQTPPPNVNPLNFPLSPPSPPGRRFAGGLGSRTRRTRAMHQHNHQEQLLQQYRGQEQGVRHYDPRYNNQQQQQQVEGADQSIQRRIIPHPHPHPHPHPQQQQQQQRTIISSSASTGHSSENTAVVIPAPPGMNYRNLQQQQQQNRSQNSVSGNINPFATSGCNPHTHACTPHKNTQQRGRFVPHVVTISLDTEPYVETTTEQVVVGSSVIGGGGGSVGVVGGNNKYNPLAAQQQQQQQLSQQYENSSSRIRTTTVAATTTGDTSTGTATTTVTRTTYNVPGRGTALGATRPHTRDQRPRLGQLLSACPLDGTKASAVTCVKFSPCTEFCLIGYGVREPHVETNIMTTVSAIAAAAAGTTHHVNGTMNVVLPPIQQIQHPLYHPVTTMYQVNKGKQMRHVSTMLSGDDDVNIARFHPDSGYGFVYGTKQGRIRVLGPRPWNYYNS